MCAIIFIMLMVEVVDNITMSMMGMCMGYNNATELLQFSRDTCVTVVKEITMFFQLHWIIFIIYRPNTNNCRLEQRYPWIQHS